MHVLLHYIYIYQVFSNSHLPSGMFFSCVCLVFDSALHWFSLRRLALGHDGQFKMICAAEVADVNHKFNVVSTQTVRAGIAFPSSGLEAPSVSV